MAYILTQSLAEEKLRKRGTQACEVGLALLDREGEGKLCWGREEVLAMDAQAGPSKETAQYRGEMGDLKGLHPNPHSVDNGWATGLLWPSVSSSLK